MEIKYIGNEVYPDKYCVTDGKPFAETLFVGDEMDCKDFVHASKVKKSVLTAIKLYLTTNAVKYTETQNGVKTKTQKIRVDLMHDGACVNIISAHDSNSYIVRNLFERDRAMEWIENRIDTLV